MTTVREIRRNWLTSRYWRWRWNRSKCFRCGDSPATMQLHKGIFIVWWACFPCGIKELEKMA